MPAKDGTGPLGRGSRTGRGMGNCQPDRVTTTNQPTAAKNTQPFHWGGRVWDITFGRLFGRWRDRINRK